MDRVLVFGTSDGGSIPSRGTKKFHMKPNQIQISKIPKNVSHVTSTLEDAGFEVYLVGGCVRDLIMGREPKDWDLTTNARPEQIIGLFEKTVYENSFGTVGVCIPTQGDVSRETSQTDVSHETQIEPNIKDIAINPMTETQKYDIIEVTPYRIAVSYTHLTLPTNREV